MGESPVAMGSDKRERPLRVLALTPHPIEGQGARYRVLQYIPYLEQRGFTIDHHPFFDSVTFLDLFRSGRWTSKASALVEGTLKRAVEIARMGRYDVVFNYLWMHPIAFPPYDWLLRSIKTPLVYDIDDPYYLNTGRMIDRLRGPEWIARLIRRAHTVIVASGPIRDFVQQYSQSIEMIPTVVDTQQFYPRDFNTKSNPRPVIGWVGSHSTAHCLDHLFPVFEELARDHPFVLRIIGSGREIRIPNVEVECQPWMLAREVDNFRDLDIGLYPLTEETVYGKAKHGFKLHQYMAVGIPAVASTIGMNPSIVRHGETAFLASNQAEWRTALSTLLRDESLRRRVGQAGRAHVQANYSLATFVDSLASILCRSAAVA